MWLLLDWYDNKNWWLVKDDEVDCTEEQMRKAVEGYFSIESARIVSNNQPTVSGMVSPYGSRQPYQLPRIERGFKKFQPKLVNLVVFIRN